MEITDEMVELACVNAWGDLTESEKREWHQYYPDDPDELRKMMRGGLTAVMVNLHTILKDREMYVFGIEHVNDQTKPMVEIAFGMEVNDLLIFTMKDNTAKWPVVNPSRRIAVLEQLVCDLTKNPDFDFDALDYSEPRG